MLSQEKLLVIGSSNIDMIMALPKLPAVGETISDGTFLRAFGGKGANQAVAAARAGGQVTFITCLGDDDGGRALLSDLAQDKLDLSLAIIAPGVATGAALIMFDAHGDNYLAVAPGANYRLLPEHIQAIAPRFSEFAMVVAQFEIPAETMDAVFEAAAQAQVPVLFNHAPARPYDAPVVGRVGLVVNESEATALTGLQVSGRDQAFTAARQLLARGCEYVIVTLGAGGSCVLSAAGQFHLPAIPSHAVDATAAGDTYCGALAVALVEGKPIQEAVKFATAASAICVRRAGAQPSIPRLAEIEELLRTEGGELCPS